MYRHMPHLELNYVKVPIVHAKNKSKNCETLGVGYIIPWKRDHFLCCYLTTCFGCQIIIHWDGTFGQSQYCKFEIFASILYSWNFAHATFREYKRSPNGEITLSFTFVGKSCSCREIPLWQICLLALIPKIKFSRIFRIYSIWAATCHFHQCGILTSACAASFLA